MDNLTRNPEKVKQESRGFKVILQTVPKVPDKTVMDASGFVSIVNFGAMNENT